MSGSDGEDGRRERTTTTTTTTTTGESSVVAMGDNLPATIAVKQCTDDAIPCGGIVSNNDDSMQIYRDGNAPNDDDNARVFPVAESVGVCCRWQLSHLTIVNM
jgi:hypothetical protein